MIHTALQSADRRVWYVRYPCHGCGGRPTNGVVDAGQQVTVVACASCAKTTRISLDDVRRVGWGK